MLARVADRFAASGHRQWLAMALLDRAIAQRGLGDLQRALEFARASSAMAIEAGARIESVRAELGIASLLSEHVAPSDQVSEAISRAETTAGELDLAPIHLITMHARGLHERSVGNVTAALECLERAAQIVEKLHSGLSDSLLGRRYTLDKLDVFDALVELTMTESTSDPSVRGINVLAATERARQRRLGELTTSQARGRGPSHTEVERELNAVYAEMLSPERRNDHRLVDLRSRAAELELVLSRAGTRCAPPVGTAGRVARDRPVGHAKRRDDCQLVLH